MHDKGIFNSSNEIRKLLFHQSETYNVSFFDICKYVHVSYRRFIKYANEKSLDNLPGYNLTDTEMSEIANLLGVKLRVQVIVLDTKVFDIQDVKNKLQHAGANKEKKSSSKIKKST